MLPDMPVVIPSYVLSQKMDEETVLLNAQTGAYFGLTPVASRAWELLQAGSRPAEVPSLLAQEFDAPIEQIQADVDILFVSLYAKQLLSF